MRLTLDAITALTGENAVRRGRALLRRGSVELKTLRPTLATGTVYGKDRYRVRVSATGGALSTSCNCPWSWDGECEHVAALLLAVLDRQHRHAGEGGDLASHLAAGTGHPHATRRVPAWAKTLARLVDGPEDRTPSTTAPSWRLAFALAVEGNVRRLRPVRIRIKRDGSDGQASAIQRLSPQEFTSLRHEDRLLLARILPRAEIEVLENGVGRAEGDMQFEGEYDDVFWHDTLLLLHGRELYLERRGSVIGHPVTVDLSIGRPHFTLSESAGELSLNPEIEWDGVSTPVSDDMVIIAVHPLWVLIERSLRRIDGLTGDELRRLQRMSTPMVVPARDRAAFLANALPLLARRYALRSSALGLRSVAGPPVPLLYLQETSGALNVELRFRYESVEVGGIPPPGNGPDIRGNDGAIVTVHRDRQREQDVLTQLTAAGLLRDEALRPALTFHPESEPLEWLVEHLPALQRAGFEVFGQETLKRYRVRSSLSRITMSVSSGIDWFDLKMEVSFEGTPASLDAFMAAVQEGKRFVKLADGTYGLLPEEWLQRFRIASALGTERADALRLARTHVTLLDELSELGEFRADDPFLHLREQLRTFDGIASRPLPAGFVGELRPYQKAGYDWLCFAHEFRFGGLLADDMGLGKTIQTLAVLVQLHAGRTGAPSLIVVPTSLVYNWQREAARFAPGLSVLVYHGLDRKRHQPAFEQHDVIITSYGILRRDIEFLKTLRFASVVLDESQNIKNFASVNARAARHLKAEWRLALTGTPVENNLTELWSQCQFLNPGMLGGLHSFTEQFVKPIERNGDQGAAAGLRRLLRPVLLRRTKELVAGDLPPKLESVVLCTMEESQRSAYQHWREYYRQSILHSIDTMGIRRSAFKVLEGLTRLRLVCCHPLLADERYKGSSGKFDAFADMLGDILAEGHRVLVFSQFVRMLAILRRHLDKLGYRYEYLDGRTTHRQERVDRFQNDPGIQVFLVSLRAGGTGLNLTGADYVIHYDPWWNPAVEAQATDRSHRIGQDKQVFSYKLITRDTVEEKILALQERKKQLVQNVISADQNFFKTLTRGDIEELFS